MIVSQNGHYELLQLLLKQQAHPNIKDEEDSTALMIANQYGHYQVVEMLLKPQADPKSEDKECRTSMMIVNLKQKFFQK